jgi:hypothetical protein
MWQSKMAGKSTKIPAIYRFLEVIFLQQKKNFISIGDAAQELPESYYLDARGHLPQIFVDFRGYGG